MFPRPDFPAGRNTLIYATRTRVSICQKFQLRDTDDAFGKLVEFFTALIGSVKNKRDMYYNSSS